MKCVSEVVKICFGKFKWLLPISILLEKELLCKSQLLVIYCEIFKVRAFLKNASSQNFVVMLNHSKNFRELR